MFEPIINLSTELIEAEDIISARVVMGYLRPIWRGEFPGVLLFPLKITEDFIRIAIVIISKENILDLHKTVFDIIKKSDFKYIETVLMPEDARYFKYINDAIPFDMERLTMIVEL